MRRYGCVAPVLAGCAVSSAELRLQSSEGLAVELHAEAILVKADRRERGNSHAEVLPFVVDDLQALGRDD